jgi:hypothetical protein
MSLMRLALLFAIYCSLDFANPMMPGAVTFGDGESVEGRQGERPRGGDVADAPPLTVTLERIPPAGPHVTLTWRPAPDVSCTWQMFLRGAHPRLSGSGSLSEDA